VKCPGFEPDHLPPPSAEVTSAWTISLPPYKLS